MNKTQIISSFILIVFLTAFLGFYPNVQAAENSEQKTINEAVEKIQAGFKGEMKTVGKKDDPAVATREFVGKIINALLGIIGSLALLVFIYSGIIWMTAGGNPEKITKAKDSMIWAALGLFVVFVSYVVIRYLIEALKF